MIKTTLKSLLYLLLIAMLGAWISTQMASESAILIGVLGFVAALCLVDMNVSASFKLMTFFIAMLATPVFFILTALSTPYFVASQAMWIVLSTIVLSVSLQKTK